MTDFFYVVRAGTTCLYIFVLFSEQKNKMIFTPTISMACQSLFCLNVVVFQFMKENLLPDSLIL